MINSPTPGIAKTSDPFRSAHRARNPSVASRGPPRVKLRPARALGARSGGRNRADAGFTDPTAVSLLSLTRPERSGPADALAVHGLSDEFLADKPLFGPDADEFLAFVGDAPLVPHNADLTLPFSMPS